MGCRFSEVPHVNPGCARGLNVPPRYVASVLSAKTAIEICLAGPGEPTASALACGTEAELREKCAELAARRVLFAIGGREGPGPEDLMVDWQNAGIIKTSFLQISWGRPNEWQIHEIVPGAQQWDIRSVDELLAARPIDL